MVARVPLTPVPAIRRSGLGSEARTAVIQSNRSRSLSSGASPLEPSTTTPSRPDSARCSKNPGTGPASVPSAANGVATGGKTPRSQAGPMAPVYRRSTSTLKDVSRRRRPIFSWVSEPTSASLANFVVATLVLGGLFAIGFLLSRDQRSGSLFLVVALICLGVGVVFAAVAGLEQVGTALLRRSGRSGREAAVAGLLAICLLVPWSVAIRAARAAEVQGWKNPVAWVAVIAIGVPLLTRSRRWMVRGLVVGGAAVAGWLIWVS